jgi:hypothetical protein
MPVKESPDLVSRQSFRGSVEGLADALGGRIDGRGVEEEAGTGQAVVPNGQGGLEMAGFDEAGGGAVYVWAALAQGRIAIISQLSGGSGAAAQRLSASVKRLESWRQLVPLRALLDSPTNTTKRLRP